MHSRDRQSTSRTSFTARVGGAAGLAVSMFLVVLAGGAVLLVAGKLQFPSLGSGADPLDVARSAGLLGFASLGVPLHLGGIDIAAVPLGMLGAIALVSIRMSRDLFVKTPGAGAIEVGAAAITFGALGVIGSAIFRFGGAEPVGTSAPIAGLLFVLWGAVFTAAGWRWARPRAEIPRPFRHEVVSGGLRAARTFVFLAAWASALGLLCLIAWRLIVEPLPRSFSPADAAAATIYVAAFLPNLLVAVFALGAGATLQIGAQIDVGGQVVGPLREISLLGHGGTSGALWFLVLVPLMVAVLGGAVAGVPSDRGARVRALALGAGVMGLAVGLLAWVGDARLGAGLVREQGVGLVAVQALPAGLLTFGWTFLGGLVGRLLIERMEGRGK